VVAVVAMVSVALSCVAEEDEIPETVKPVPAREMVEELEKCVLVPVMVIGTVAPCRALAGLI